MSMSSRTRACSIGRNGSNWTYWCAACKGTGNVWLAKPRQSVWCNECAGTARDAIPWSELFSGSTTDDEQ